MELTGAGGGGRVAGVSTSLYEAGSMLFERVASSSSKAARDALVSGEMEPGAGGSHAISSETAWASSWSTESGSASVAAEWARSAASRAVELPGAGAPEDRESVRSHGDGSSVGSDEASEDIELREPLRVGTRGSGMRPGALGAGLIVCESTVC